MLASTGMVIGGVLVRKLYQGIMLAMAKRAIILWPRLKTC